MSLEIKKLECCICNNEATILLELRSHRLKIPLCSFECNMKMLKEFGPLGTIGGNIVQDVKNEKK